MLRPSTRSTLHCLPRSFKTARHCSTALPYSLNVIQLKCLDSGTYVPKSSFSAKTLHDRACISCRVSNLSKPCSSKRPCDWKSLSCSVKFTIFVLFDREKKRVVVHMGESSEVSLVDCCRRLRSIVGRIERETMARNRKGEHFVIVVMPRKRIMRKVSCHDRYHFWLLSNMTPFFFSRLQLHRGSGTKLQWWLQWVPHHISLLLNAVKEEVLPSISAEVWSKASMRFSKWNSLMLMVNRDLRWEASFWHHLESLFLGCSTAAKCH